MTDETDFYVCPNHTRTGGWESCCSCGGWAEGEPLRLCTEELEHMRTRADSG
jgi:hypothetical protein